MKRVLFLLLVAIIVAGCRKEDSPPGNTGDSSAQVIIDGKSHDWQFDAFNSCNKNCDNLFINLNYKEEGNGWFTIRFHLKESGAIDRIWYLGHEEQFESSFFDPYNHFKIDNFTFNDKTNALYFEFEGNLFLNNTRSLFLKGKVDIPVLKETECRNYSTNVLTLHNGTTRLLHRTTNTIISRPNTPEESFRYHFFTDNGFHFTLNSEKNLHKLPRGEYNFNPDDITNNVALKEYTALPDIIPWIDDRHWTPYKTTGSYTITGQFERDDRKTTVGLINIKAYKESELKYDLENIYFEVVD